MSRSRRSFGCDSLRRERGRRGVECGSAGTQREEKETYAVLMRADVQQKATVMRDLCHLMLGGCDRFRSSALGHFWVYLFFYLFVEGRYIIESTENPFPILMQSSLIHEEIGWSGYLYLSKCLLMWQIERERGEGKGQMEEVREKRR